MTQGGNIYRAAERRLLDAIRAGVVCDFADGAEITAAEMASWGPERTVRATLLRRLLTAEDAEYAEDGVQLRGAAVEGVLILQDLNVMQLDLRQCRIKSLEAGGATFTGDAGVHRHDLHPPRRVRRRDVHRNRLVRRRDIHRLRRVHRHDLHRQRQVPRHDL
jgi:hypothetical protein